MKIALIGYGKMGQAIEKIASRHDVEIVSRIDPKAPEADWKKVSGKAVAHADVCIDFSHPNAVLHNIKETLHLQKPIVVGTTGWQKHLETVKVLAEESRVGVVYADNFSLGMSFFAKIVEAAGKLIDPLEDYDVAISEVHHNQKIDTPSGTALSLAHLLLNAIERKTSIKSDGGKVNPEELHISSVRVGKVPGTHSVIFDSEQDTITLTHQAHNRGAWAQGALQAAKWVQNRKGLFHINDMMESFICNTRD